MTATVVFNSRRVRRTQLAQGARHALVGLGLAFAGARSFADGHGTWPDAVGLAGGVLLLIAFVREMRAVRTAHAAALDAPHGIGWVDVFAAAVTAVEAWHLHHQGKHGLPIAYGFVALLLLALGLAHPQLARLRRLVVTDEGVDLRNGPFRRFRAPWSDVVAVTANGTVVSVVLANGTTRAFDFSDADNAALVVETFVSAAPRPAPPAPQTPAIDDAPATAPEQNG